MRERSDDSAAWSRTKSASEIRDRSNSSLTPWSSTNSSATTPLSEVATKTSPRDVLPNAYLITSLISGPRRFRGPILHSARPRPYRSVVCFRIQDKQNAARRVAGRRISRRGSSRTLGSCHFAIDQRSLALGSVSIVQQRPAVTHHAMAGNSEGDRIVGTGLADRPERLGTRNATSQLREGGRPTGRNGEE